MTKKKQNKQIIKEGFQKCCLKCGCLDIKILSSGEILCQNPKCLAVTILEKLK